MTVLVRPGEVHPVAEKPPAARRPIDLRCPPPSLWREYVRGPLRTTFWIGVGAVPVATVGVHLARALGYLGG